MVFKYFYVKNSVFSFFVALRFIMFSELIDFLIILYENLFDPG